MQSVLNEESTATRLRDRLQFYVTPHALAAQCWKKFKGKAFKRVLDAFAGTGALSEAAPDFGGRYAPSIDCIEIDASKHPVLRSKGLHVVGLDFFNFSGGEIYSHVVLNPPFAQGARAVLKAWDMLWEGEVVAIINAETLRNPFSNERKQLQKLVVEHGSVEYIAQAFNGPDAERKADVDIAVVHLVKPASCARDWIGDLLRQMTSDETQVSSPQLPTELMLPQGFIETQCAVFRAAVRAMREAVRIEAVANHCAARIGKSHAELASDALSAKTINLRSAFEVRYDDLKDRAWMSVLRSTETMIKLSSKVQRQAESQFEVIKKLDFNEANIYSFLIGLIESQPEMRLEMACEIFDRISRHHSKNVVFYRGWKSNDRHRTCGMRLRDTRFVIPSCKSYGSFADWETQQMVSDFDKVFAMLDGKQKPEQSLRDVFAKQFKELCAGQRISSSYFDVRYYKGIGTIHLFPRSKALIDTLNRLVGHHRQWLPPPDEVAPKAFWLQFDQAEKLDAELRDVMQGRSSKWADPFCQVMWSDTNPEQHVAREKIVDALDEVLLQHGIKLTNELERASSTQNNLLLTATIAAVVKQEAVS